MLVSQMFVFIKVKNLLIPIQAVTSSDPGSSGVANLSVTNSLPVISVSIRKTF